MNNLLKREIAKIRQERGNSPLVYLVLFWRLASLLRYFLYARLRLRSANELGRLLFARGSFRVDNQGHLRVGNKSRFWGSIHPTQLIVGNRGRLDIGKGCYINGALISAQSEVILGDGCYLAPMAHILDSPYFGLGEAASIGDARPVTIAEDAWLATRCTVMGGVRIGRGAVIAVGALVTEDVPDYCIAGGVPAKVIGRVKPKSPPEEALTQLEKSVEK